MGDIFFHEKTIIFDKKNNQIGFISQEKIITVFPDSDFVYYIFDSIGVLALLSAAFIFLLRKRHYTIGELSEMLKNREVEITNV